MKLDDIFFDGDPNNAPIEVPDPNDPTKFKAVEDIIEGDDDDNTDDDDDFEGSLNNPTDTPPAADDDDPDSKPDDTTQAYFDFLVELDILRTPEDFKFDGSPTKLKEALQHTKQSLAHEVASNLWGSLPTEFRPLLEYGLKGGTSLEEYFNAYADVDYSTMDLTDVNNQRRIMADYYRQTTTQPPEKINKYIARLEEAGDLAAEAEDTIQELMTMQTKRKNELMAKTERERMQREMEQKQKVDNLVNAIETSNFIHPSRRGKVRSFFFSPVKLEDDTVTTGFNYTIQAILQNPEHQAQLADILLEYDANKGFSTDRLEKKVSTKAADSFRKTLTEKLDPSSRSSASKNAPTNSPKFDWNEFAKL